MALQCKFNSYSFLKRCIDTGSIEHINFKGSFLNMTAALALIHMSIIVLVLVSVSALLYR